METNIVDISLLIPYRKILILELWAKMLSANQIARFLRSVHIF